MKLKDWKESKNKNTAKVSEITRQLALAGIAIIWIFKQTQDGKDVLPKELLGPTTCFVASLFLEILQYLYLSIFLTLFYRIKEANLIKANKTPSDPHPDVSEINVTNENVWIINISYIPWILKVVVLLYGYYLVGSYLVQELQV